MTITMSSAHSPTVPSLHLRQNSFSNPPVALPTSQLILQPFRCFTYVTALPILQTFRHFTYVTAHSPTLPLLYLRHSSAHSPIFPSLYLRHSSFSNPPVALPTTQVILQPLRCFSYIAVHSPALLSFFLRHRLFTYVTWRAAHGSTAVDPIYFLYTLIVLIN